VRNPTESICKLEHLGDEPQTPNHCRLSATTRRKSKSQNVGFNLFFLSGFWRGCKRFSFSKRFVYRFAPKIRFCGHWKPRVLFWRVRVSVYHAHHTPYLPRKNLRRYTQIYENIRKSTFIYFPNPFNRSSRTFSNVVSNCFSISFSNCFSSCFCSSFLLASASRA